MGDKGWLILGIICIVFLAIWWIKAIIQFLISGGWVWVLVIVGIIVLYALFSNN